MNEITNTARRSKHSAARRRRKWKKRLRTTALLLFCGVILYFGVSAYKNIAAPAAASLLNRDVVDMLKDLQKTDSRPKPF